MEKHSSNRFLPLAAESPDVDSPGVPNGGRASRPSSRRSASLSGLSERPNLKDLADAALNERAAETLDALRKLVDAPSSSRGHVRKHGEFAPDGTPQAERTARAERWVRAHNSMSSLGGHSAADDEDRDAAALNGDGHTVTLQPAATRTLDPPARAPAADAAPTSAQSAPTPVGHAPKTVLTDFVTAGSLLRPSVDPNSGMTLLWPTPAESARTAPTRAQAGRSSGRPPRPRSQQAQPPPSRDVAPGTSVSQFKIPAVPDKQTAPTKKTIRSFDVDEGIWTPYTGPARLADGDSLGATSMDVSPPLSLVADLRSIKQEEDDADSWLQTSAGRGGYEYSPPPSPTTEVLGLRDGRRKTAATNAAPRGDVQTRPRGQPDPSPAPRDALHAQQDTAPVERTRPFDGEDSQGFRDGLTDDEEDMYVDDVPRGHGADFSDDDAGLDSQETDEDHVASDEDRIIAGAIDPAFEQTRIPMRAASRTTEVIDGVTAGSMWAGVDPGTLAQWAKLATGNFGVRIHSVDGDTNIAAMNSVQLKLDLQNTIRCTEPNSEAMVAPGRAAQGSPPAAPGLFLVHNVSLRTAEAWMSHQLFQVGRYCVIVFARDHGDSRFVGTWTESTMPCSDLESGLREKCKDHGRVRGVFKEVEAESKGQGGKSFRRFLASITVRPLVIKPRGSRGVEVTEYNVYTGPIEYDTRNAAGEMIRIPLSTERRARLHEAMLEIQIPDAFHGAAVRRNIDLKPYNCAICHSKSHPRGKCPAHDIPKWGRPLRRPQDRRTRQRQNPTNSRRSPPPQPAAAAPPTRNARAGPSTRGKNGRAG